MSKPKTKNTKPPTGKFPTNVPVTISLLNAYSSVYEKYMEQYPIQWDTRKSRFAPMLNMKRCRMFCAIMSFSLVVDGIPFAIVARKETQGLPDAQLWLFLANFLLVMAQGLLAQVTFLYGSDLVEFVNKSIQLEKRVVTGMTKKI